MYNNEELLKRLADGDLSAKNLLIENNIGLIHNIVRRFLNRGHEAEDLFQVGCIGLIKAVDKFDINYGVKFSTYAVPMIMGEIKRFIRDDGIIKVSRSIKETAVKAVAIRERITAEHGREPTVTELADELSVTPEELSFALDAGLHPESLYATGDDGSSEIKPLIDRIECPENYENNTIDRLLINELVSALDEREQRIITLRYFKQKTQAQVAAELGISQVQVSRIEKKLLLKMRQTILAE